MKIRIMVILLAVEGNYDGRKTLESIENTNYESVDDICKAVGTDECRVLNMSDFMDLCNNSDPSNENLNKDEIFEVGETWVGYVNLIEK